MVWTLKYDDTVNTIASFGINNIKRVRKNLLTDKVMLHMQGNSLSSLSTFAANAPIKIFNDGNKWFEGIVTQTPLYCSSNSEAYVYEVSGVWWYLENLIYQQAWKEPIDPTEDPPTLYNVYKSKVILGLDISGSLVTIGQQISDVINYAISCGISLAIGSIDIPVNIPLDECKDLSCADIIRRLLRWVPDTVCYVNYSFDVPTISFMRRSQLPSATLNILSHVQEFSIQPRYDLQVPAVVLKFETTNSVNGKMWKESVQQRFPATCTGSELKALVLTINLEGSKTNYVVQNITTSPIDTSSIAWWQAHVPGIINIPVSNISVGNVSRSSELPNELIGGTIANWMNKTAEVDIIRCKISYADINEAVIDREVAVRILATNATTGIYKSLLSLITVESIPSNLAEQIYNSVNPLQYDGTVVTISEEVSQDFFGKTLNIIGGQPAWETMYAMVQEVIEHLDSGKIFIKFGPAKHLGAADLAELTRSGRLLFESKNHSERITAEVSGNETVEQGIYARVDNTSFGLGKYKMIKFADPNNLGRTIQIDTTDIAVSEATIKFREENVCESGVLKKRYSLASEPYFLQ
ncbi:MAG: hypothetical protein LBB16_02545 [Puniceicoccales bacterium]|jgi:hypothetical protein|nr:hypothetical protein [Puniceicoccales bacterium]